MLDDRDRPSDGREDLEAALVLHYSRLVRIAYLALPPEGDRHGRVLAAHAIVQRALPGGGGWWLDPRGRRLRKAGGDSYAVLRAVVVRSVLRGSRRSRVLYQPYVWGLRLFPLGGGSEEMQMDAALRELTTTARMAYVLLALEGLPADEIRALLTRAGASGVPAALASAERLSAEHLAEVLKSSEFDPCTLRTRPTDLSRRRLRVRAATGATAAALTLGVAAVVGFSGSGPDGAAGGTAGTADAAAQASVRVAADAWRESARIDFGVWPARGDDAESGTKVGQALEAWTVPHSDVFRLGPGASEAPPVSPVHVLWNGHVDGAAVVLLYDTTRLARYTVPDHPTADDPVRLDVVRADDSDVTTAGAVVLRSTAAGDRWLVAPWVDTVAVRDVKAPDVLAKSMAFPDGVTGVVPRPVVSTCGSWPVLQMQSSPQIAEHHTFLLADLGGVTGTHLTYTPPPKAGPALAPREGTGPDALVAESRVVCGLGSLQGRDVKQINTWSFAQQTLPANQGVATWVCLRADDWTGVGTSTGEFLPPAARVPATVTGTEEDGKSCTRFDQNVVAQTRWRGPDGRTYLLVAGSRHVVKLGVADASGAVRTTVPAPDHTAATPMSEAAAMAAGSAGAAVGILDTGATVRAFHP
ncbi:hypothetical protein [Catenulispora subtropica]|uniref:DNA-directed RNA polymerase specialized sigma24 family protein n=1 Tax=Catenulispora subtropica TaxID=450798 RepID=A0ABP5CVH5_9ACTN